MSQLHNRRYETLQKYLLDAALFLRVLIFDCLLEHCLGPPRSIDRVSASVVFSGGPDACDFVLLVHLSLNHVAQVYASKCRERQSAFAHVRRDATAGPSDHWLRVSGYARHWLTFSYVLPTASPDSYLVGLRVA
jgi:hypothetical protein